MSTLKITVIDVGWGDSIFLEFVNDQDDSVYGLIDSNDTVQYQSSFIYLKRFFERKNIKLPEDKPLFEFIMLSHAHADHAQGLKKIMREFGTKNFYYPKSLEWKSFAQLIGYANRSKNVIHHQAIDNTKQMNNFGDIPINILWPNFDTISTSNENNNSIVLVLKHGSNSFLLTGDAEGEVWEQIGHQIPSDTKYFKVPHHGSAHGTLHNGGTPWLDHCPNDAFLPISAHVRPYGHPNQEVITIFEHRNLPYFRTDDHHHLQVISDENNVKMKYSHI
ncbi:ComEC/Rec2 family competence protein [Costertonia aggregata]|uniref:MBL fold metallo-hydrolase n=1 Tax=Costertonia aggregata TaxID=343403 RepID=A0A7H9ANK4_9FLAO|nr:MBL fold metallo-hydrolase [Costertonia aggregata]QLG44855.1 MBL fold metallo-hydrolase [Costertonia aggregata]